MLVLRLIAASAIGLVVEARLGGDERAEDAPALCAPEVVQETCALFGGSVEAEASAVGERLAATEAATGDFWAAAQLAVGAAAPCADLCRGSVALLRGLGRVVPAASDTGCYHERGEVVCDLDLSPKAIQKLAGKSKGDFAYGKGLPGLGEESLQNVSLKEAKTFGYSVEDFAARLAQLFRIYPASGGGIAIDAPQLGGARAKAFDQSLVERRLGHAQAYVNLALRAVPSRGTSTEVSQWFGPSALAHQPSRDQILKVLNSVANVLGRSRITAGPECRSGVFAYVFPCHGSPGEKDDSGRYNLFLCDEFFSVQEEQICTLVHEASHHTSACTKDIIYGTSACMMLARVNPQYALYNADNYGYYIREVARSHGTF